MTSNICFSCKRKFSDHTREESFECALELCKMGEVADIACGVDNIILKPTSFEPPKKVN